MFYIFYRIAFGLMMGGQIEGHDNILASCPRVEGQKGLSLIRLLSVLCVSVVTSFL